MGSRFVMCSCFVGERICCTGQERKKTEFPALRVVGAPFRGHPREFTQQPENGFS